MKSIKPFFYASLCILLMGSCVSRKKIVYFQEPDVSLVKSKDQKIDNNIAIKPDDVLTIRVSAPEQEAAMPFNLTKSVTGQANMAGQVELETYLVSDAGTIEFPVIGTIEVKGLTNIELSTKIRGLIQEYVKDPIVNVRILNFQVSVLGEVNQPGNFTIEDDHISLSKALAMAGDLTIFGKRDNILIISEEDDIKTYSYVDLTKASAVNSPHYNLKQNDVVYVEPKGSRRQNAGSLGIASTYISIASVIASIVILVTNSN